MNDLQAYDWPGNIRELQNVLERAAILSKGGKLLLNLPTQTPEKKIKTTVARNEDNVFTDEEMKLREKENLLRALQQCGGRVTGENGAAEILKMKPTTLYSRIKKFRATPGGNEA